MAPQIGLSLQEYLDRNIKEVINEFPRLVDVLGRYDIGCASCGLGTCRFKDIVEIHNLGVAQETALMAEVARILFPNREVINSKFERKGKPSRTPTAYSPPMRELVKEHELIKRWLAVIPDIVDHPDSATERGRQTIRRGIDFIRSYADKFHHAKEEDILFGYFDPNLDIIKTIRADHEQARAYVREVLAALNRQDLERVAINLKAYRDLLTEHIKKEDDILYRWMDRNLSVTQIGDLYSRFQQIDAAFGDTPQQYLALIEQFEKDFNKE